MDEQKKEEEAPTEPKTATPDTDVGVPTAEEERIVTDAKAVAETQKAAEELKAANLEKEEKLLDRKEALDKLGGGSPAGTESAPKFTDEEKASRKRIKAVADASGSSWGKNYE